MNVLDHKILESWMSSQDPEVSKLPRDFDHLGLSSFTHIATDGKTLHWLMKYTQEAVHGWGILYLDKLEEISAAVLMVLFRHGSVDHIHFPSLKTLDLSCARMLVRAIAEEKSNLITFGFGFDISNISPEVLVELSKVRYGWYDSGGFSIYSEQYYKDQESHLI